MTYHATVQEEFDGGPLIIVLPPELLEELDLKVGDEIVWEIGDGSVSFRKVE